MDKVSREIRENPKLKELAKAAAQINGMTSEEVFDELLRQIVMMRTFRERIQKTSFELIELANG